MKKNLLKAVMLLLALNSSIALAQTTIFNADFTDITVGDSDFFGTNPWTYYEVPGGSGLIWPDYPAYFGAGEYLCVPSIGGGGASLVNTEVQIQSPIIDLTGYERLTLSLKMLIDTEASYDGVYMLFSTDGGTTYYELGKENDNALNWYNETNILSFDDFATVEERGWSGTFNSGNWFTASIDLPSQGFDNASNVKFAIEIRTDGSDPILYKGLGIDDFKVVGYPITAKTYPSCSVWDKQELWLNPASLSALSDGDKVDRWENSSLINPDWTDAQSTGALRPTYNDDATSNVNFNPVVTFDGTNSMFGREGFYNHDIYIVINPNTPISSAIATQDVFLGDDYLEISASQDVTGISVNNTSARYGAASDIVAYNQGPEDKYGKAFVSSTLSYDRPVIFNARLNAAGTGMDLYLDGVNLDLLGSTSEVFTGTFKNILNSRYWLGQSEFFGPSFNGDILEVMVFSERKTDLERKQIESYLGVKYGVTLGLFPVTAIGLPHIPGEYYDSAGTPLWNGLTDVGYTYNVTGIGRDDCVSLNQKQAKSIDPNTFITIGLGDIYDTNSNNPNTFANDRDFLMWGSTPSTLTALPTPLEVDLGPSLVTTFTDVSERTWKFVETTATDIPTVKLSVSTAGLATLPALTGNDAYVMIVADDDSFTTNVETVFLTTNGGEQQCNYDFDGTKYVKFGVAHEVVSSRHIEFDGVNDYVKIGDNLDQTGAFTVSAWINTSGSNNDASEKTIVSKRDGATDGYHFYISDANKLVMQYGASTVTEQIISNTTLNTGEWRNVAFTFDGATGKLYIDGVEDNSKAMVAPTANANEFTIGARFVDKADIRNNFAGNLEEIRFFSDAISVDEIRFIMNQEIVDNGGLIEGTIINNTISKNDLGGRTWNTLEAYFNMNTYIGTHLNDASGNGHRGALLSPSNFNIKEQTAPLPYVSTANGDWQTATTWSNGASQYYPYATKTINGVATPIAWNIVETQHLVTSNTNQVVLGLINTANTLSIGNDTKLEVSHYLKIDSKIDLVEKSQLVQTLNSDLDPTSAGVIERDQQGQTNQFNYNYWSLPVGVSNTTTNNNNYNLSTNFKDGRTATPQDITWIGGYNSSTTPTTVSLAHFWLYKYESAVDDYYNWIHFIETDDLLPGQGYIMKGSNAGTATQDYTFIGKPYNGSITRSVGANQSVLLGNPYASALDANAFITDNLASITGTLYFWEHYSTNNSHNTADYQGGYATKTLTGATPPVAPAIISGLGSSARTPKQFIPVGQGFFLDGNATGGSVVFNNNQRLFVKEDNAASSIMFKGSSVSKTTPTYNNDDDFVAADNFIKIRLGITSVSEHKRQLLLGFMNENATNDYDNGYDGEVYETLPSDAYFYTPNHNLVIQGVGVYNENEIYPIAVKSNAAGDVVFNLDDLSHIDAVANVFIYDNETETYHDIKNEAVTIAVEAGTTTDRFSLRFTNTTSALSVDDYNIIDGITYNYVQNEGAIVIKNTSGQETIKTVGLINMLGQKVMSWNVKEGSQNNIVLPVKTISSGVYIIQLKTKSGKQNSKKVIVD